MKEILDLNTSSFQSLLEYYENFEKNNEKSLAEQLEGLELCENRTEMKRVIEESYKETAINVCKVIKCKLDYLKALKL